MKGATFVAAAHVEPYFSFNPRPREGGDEHFRSGGDDSSVSIHAPVKGATQKAGYKPDQNGFQSTPP